MAERLEIRITARGEQAKREVKQVRDRVIDLDAATSRFDKRFTPFQRIAEDVRRAKTDFDAGTISARDYATALEFAKQEALELRQQGLKPVGPELKAFNSVLKQSKSGLQAVGKSSKRSVPGVGRLRRSLGSLAAVSAGLPGRLGTVVSTLSGFAISSLTAAGIFAGLAALGLAFKKIRDRTKEAEERVESFLKKDFVGRLAREELEAEAAQTRITRDRLIRELRAGGRFQEIKERGVVQRLDFVPFSDKEIRERREELNRISKQFRDQEQKRTEEAEKQAQSAERAARAQEEAAQRLETAVFRLSRSTDVAAVAAFDPSQVRPELFPGTRRGALSATIQGRFRAVSQGRQAIDPTTGLRTGGLAELPEFAQKLVDPETGAFAKSVLDAERISRAMKDTAKGVEESGRNLVTGIGQIGSALAQIASGRGLSGLSSLAFAGAGFATGGLAIGLGIAGTAFGFVDALSSDSHKNTIREANLAALREHDRTRPPARIIIAGGLDPDSREFQRLVNETGREAAAQGFRARVG